MSADVRIPWKTGTAAGIISIVTGSTLLHYLVKAFSDGEPFEDSYFELISIFVGYLGHHVLYHPIEGWLPFNQEIDLPVWLYLLPPLVLMSTGYYMARHREGSESPVIAGASTVFGYLALTFFFLPFVLDSFLDHTGGIMALILQPLVLSSFFGGLGGFLFGHQEDISPKIKRGLRRSTKNPLAISVLLVLVVLAGTVLIASDSVPPDSAPDSTTCSENFETGSSQTQGTLNPPTVEARKLSTGTAGVSSEHPAPLTVEEIATAGVNMEADESNGTLEVTIVTMGNADYVILEGDHLLHCNPYLNKTGQTLTLTERHLEESGEITAVGVIGEGEFYEERGVPTMEVEERATETALKIKSWYFTETR